MNIVAFLVSAIRIGMSFLLGATGETITEKSGHLNLGIPGIMCVGASSGCLVESMYIDACGGIDAVNPVIAVILPILASFIGGGIMGLIYSFLTVTLRANQNVTGLALTTLGTGVSNYMIALVKNASFSQASKFFTASLPFADGLGVIGKLFFSYGIFVYLAIAIALVASFVLSRTRVGLHLRAVGENPNTADAASINVTKYKYGATCIGSMIAGLGGLYYVMDYASGVWSNNAFGDRGWLAIALVIFTIWRANVGVLASILFGGLYILHMYIPTGSNPAVKELYKMLPYIVTIVVLCITSLRKKREDQPPQHLGLPYFREER